MKVFRHDDKVFEVAKNALINIATCMCVSTVVQFGGDSEEQQRDSVSPESADSLMSLSSPQQHSSSSSASSVSSLSLSDNVCCHNYLVLIYKGLLI